MVQARQELHLHNQIMRLVKHKNESIETLAAFHQQSISVGSPSCAVQNLKNK
jgi:hypothetical protein